MALPIIAVPTYEVTVPSTKESIKYRPFLVKEEKALLIAQQSEDSATMVNTLKTVIKSCTMDSVNVDKLAIFDIEYLFAQIRAKSVGENVSLIFKCDTCTDDKAKVKKDIDLTKLAVHFPEEHQSNISLFGDVGVMMKYPSIDIVKEFENIKDSDVETIFKIICACVDFIYDGEQVYHSKDQSASDVEQFVNNLTQDQFKKLQSFFETMPKLKHRIEYNCPVCTKYHDVSLEGLDGFFS